MKSDPTLPLDGQRILELAARSMFDLFANASEGMLLVDRAARVVWINDQYKRFLPALGFERVEDFLGHPVSEVVHNTQMHRVLETGKPWRESNPELGWRMVPTGMSPSVV